MTHQDLDSIYTQLADAILAAGDQRDLFLSMLSLKLLSQSEDFKASEATISEVLKALR